MKLKHLRQFLEKCKDLPDNTPVLRPGHDHDYIHPSNIDIESVLYNKRYDSYCEYYKSTHVIGTDEEIVKAVLIGNW